MPSSAAHTRPAAAGRKRGNMFTKWTRKEAARFFICFAVFFALVLLTQLPGFLMWIWIVALLVIGEIMRRAIGYQRPAGIRVCVPIMSLVPMGYLIPMFFTKASFLAAAAAELDPA